MKKLSSIHVIVVALAFTANLYADEFFRTFHCRQGGCRQLPRGRPQVFFGNEGKVVETRGQVRVGDSIRTGAAGSVGNTFESGQLPETRLQLRVTRCGNRFRCDAFRVGARIGDRRIGYL
jgi:hypothetical protein